MKKRSFVCPHCGSSFETLERRAIHWLRTRCGKAQAAAHKSKAATAEQQPESVPAHVSGFQFINRGDGTFLVGRKGDNIHLNHWHIAEDGTVLSVVENGVHLHRRTDVTQNIIELCPEIGLSKPWKG